MEKMQWEGMGKGQRASTPSARRSASLLIPHVHQLGSSPKPLLSGFYGGFIA